MPTRHGGGAVAKLHLPALDHHHHHHLLHFSAPRKLVEKSNLPSSHLTSARCPSLMCYSKGSSAWRDLGMPTMSLSDGIGMGAILNIRRIPTLSPQLHSIAPTHFLRLARPHLHFRMDSLKLYLSHRYAFLFAYLA